LEHIRGIDAGTEALIEPRNDHLPQAAAMPVEKVFNRRPFSRARTSQ
jgi:hypothetical protein